jgi:hypothetical protein
MKDHPATTPPTHAVRVVTVVARLEKTSANKFPTVALREGRFPPILCRDAEPHALPAL